MRLSPKSAEICGNYENVRVFAKIAEFAINSATAESQNPGGTDIYITMQLTIIITPLFISLHWLPVAAHIKFKTLMLAYRTTTGSAPTYFHSLMTIYIPSRSLRSASERRLVVPSQRGSKSLSRTFSFTVPGCWNDLPPHPECWIPVNLQATTENSSLSTLLDFSQKKNNLCLSLYLFLLLLACTYLNNV